MRRAGRKRNEKNEKNKKKERKEASKQVSKLNRYITEKEEQIGLEEIHCSRSRDT